MKARLARTGLSLLVCLGLGTMGLPATAFAADSAHTAPYTSVKNQGDFNSCWAFGLLGSSESNYLLKQGAAGGVQESDTVDFSEAALVYATCNEATEGNALDGTPLNRVDGDYASENSSQYGYDKGPGLFPGIAALAAGRGIADESEAPYRSQTSEVSDMAQQAAQNYFTSHLRLKDASFLNPIYPQIYKDGSYCYGERQDGTNGTDDNLSLWKERLSSTGSLCVTYYSSIDAKYYQQGFSRLSNFDNGIAPCYWVYDANPEGEDERVDEHDGNHSVLLVGYDDGFSRYNFATPLEEEKSLDDKDYDKNIAEVVKLYQAPVFDENGHLTNDPKQPGTTPQQAGAQAAAQSQETPVQTGTESTEGDTAAQMLSEDNRQAREIEGEADEDAGGSDTAESEAPLDENGNQGATQEQDQEGSLDAAQPQEEQALPALEANDEEAAAEASPQEGQPASEAETQAQQQDEAEAQAQAEGEAQAQQQDEAQAQAQAQADEVQSEALPEDASGSENKDSQPAAAEAQASAAGQFSGIDPVFGTDYIVPLQDGAWQVKNSWGTNADGRPIGENGIFYFSYYERTMCEGVSMEVENFAYSTGESPRAYQLQYQHDASTPIAYTNDGDENLKAANIFTAGTATDEDCLIKAVGISVPAANTQVELQCYVNLSDENDPTSGTQVASQSFTIDYAGYHIIELDTPFEAANNSKMSVVASMKSDYALQSGREPMYETTGTYVPLETTLQDSNYYNSVVRNAKGCTKVYADGAWVDSTELNKDSGNTYGNLTVKLLGDPVEKTVPQTNDNTATSSTGSKTNTGSDRNSSSTTAKTADSTPVAGLCAAAALAGACACAARRKAAAGKR